MRKINEIDQLGLDVSLAMYPGEPVEEVAKKFCNYMQVPYDKFSTLVLGGLRLGFSNYRMIAIIYDKVISDNNITVEILNENNLL